MSREGKETNEKDNITESLKQMIAISESDDAINDFLGFLGKKYYCERVYVFEKRNYHIISNTYEWCAEGVVSQKDLLQEEPVETVESWWELFEKGKAVVIRNLEEIKHIYPEIYAVLKPQGIVSLIAAPICIKGELIGFIGVDNPAFNPIESLPSFLLEIGYFFGFVLEKRDLIRHLEYVSYHDQLTGAYNRYAYDEYIENFKKPDSIGVLYCDIFELKRVNDSISHIHGNEIIKSWYKTIKSSFPNGEIYRVSGDEFVVICINLSKEQFYKLSEDLKKTELDNASHLAFGIKWTDKEPNIQKLINQAEMRMYQAKAQHCSQKNFSDIRVKESLPYDKNQQHDRGMHSINKFENFLRRNYYDLELFFEAISMSDNYPYFGDIQSGMFYISDKMKELFGFTDNIVFDLPEIWKKRISNSVELELYEKDVDDIMQGRKLNHDLRYRVKDKFGNNIWVHGYGKMKWNEDNSKPLFFAGAISSHEKEFVVDVVTNFPKEQAAIIKIRALQSKYHSVSLIGFTLNNFSEINELRGRDQADHFMSRIANQLARNFEGKLMFFRLDGIRFVGLVHPKIKDNLDGLVKEIKEVISSVYYSNDIVVQVPCSVGVIYEATEDLMPQELLVNMINLLSQAKSSPDKEYIIYSQNNSYLQKVKAQLVLELSNNVLQGLKNFRVVVQPVVSADDTSIVSGEVLLRWKFEGKDISPSVFVPLLEKNNLILLVGQWVFEQTVRVCQRAITYLPNFRLGVNISYYQILDPAFLGFIKQTLEKYKLEGKHIIIEITETHYDEKPGKVREFVESCRQMGIEVAIDDFGDGYSSLAFLVKYPATIVKLDRSLISEMNNSENTVNFISSIIYACHKFGKRVCAEGVETQSEYEILKNSGCDIIQGYYFHKPMEIKQLYPLLSDISEKNLDKINKK